MAFERFLKRYVWDDEKTPYLVSVSNLNRRQADYEIRAFNIFVGTLFAVISIASLSPLAPHGRSIGVSLYAFSIVCATIIFGTTKAYAVALYLSAAPVATIGYLLTFGMLYRVGGADALFAGGFVAVWLVYSIRLAAIGRQYPHMPEPPPSRERSRWR